MPDSSSLSDADILAALSEIAQEQPEDVTAEAETADDGEADDGWRDAEDVGAEAAEVAWAEAGRELLLETARRYRRTVTHKQLAAEVQERSRISTTRRSHYWVGDVLARVAAECDRRDEPLLSSLCVKSDGSMGQPYADVVAAVRGDAPADADLHAAAERLACHRHFDAPDLPDHGGLAALTPAVENRRAREKKIRLEERVAPICPSCSMQLPATGVCDSCD
jgi:hypothetical protein